MSINDANVIVMSSSYMLNNIFSDGIQLALRRLVSIMSSLLFPLFSASFRGLLMKDTDYSRVTQQDIRDGIIAVMNQ